MATVDENIQALSHAVMTEAQGEAEQKLEEARKKADDIRAKSEEQAAADRTRILENANKEADRLRKQTIASAHLKARTLQLEQREEILNRVFDQARKQLTDVQNDGGYKEVAVSLLKEALGRLGSNSAIVQADERTQKIFTPDILNSVSTETGVKLELGEPLKQGNGVVVQTADGHLRYDNTLETRMGRLQDSLRNPIYQLLMGETQ